MHASQEIFAIICSSVVVLLQDGKIGVRQSVGRGAVTLVTCTFSFYLQSNVRTQGAAAAAVCKLSAD